MSITAAKLQVDVTADTSSAERGLAGVSKSVGKTPAVFGLAQKAAVGLGLGFAAAASGAVVMGIKTASNLQQADIAFTTMLGSGTKAKDFLGTLQKFAAATPFEFPDVVRASQRLLAMGFAAKDVIPTLTGIGDAVAGLGGGKEQIQQVTTAIGQMQAKGKIQSDELLQLTEAGIPALKILADTYGVTTGEMQNMVTKGKILSDKAVPALIAGLEKGTKSTAAFGGMMEKQSHTMAGAWSTLMDTFNMGMANILKPLVPLISTLIPAVTNGLAASFKGFSSVMSVVVGWVARVAGGLPALWSSLTGGLSGATAAGTGFSNLVGVVQAALVTFAAQVMGVVRPAFAALVVVWNTNVKPALTALVAAFQGAMPGVLAFVAVIVNVATATRGYLMAALQVIVPVLIRVAGIIAGVVVGAVRIAIQVIGALGQGFANTAKFVGQHSTVFSIIAGIITAVFIPAMISAGIQAALSAAKVVAGWVAQGIAAVASGAETAAIWLMLTADSIAGAASQGLSFARVIGGWVLMGTQSLIQGARMAAAWVLGMGPIGWVIVAVVAVVALIVKNWDTIVKATSTAWAAVTGWIVNAWNNIKGWVSTAVAFVVGFVKSHWVLLVGIIGGPLALAVALVIKHWSSIKAFISGAVAAVKGWVSGAFNAVVGYISGAMSRASGVVSSAWMGIKNGVSSGVAGVVGFVKTMPAKILGALGAVGTMLYNAGASIIAGLANGIRNGLGAVTGAVRNVLGAARKLLPFSPAKEGPFSGRGWTLYSGRSISAALATGLTDNTHLVRAAALRMATAAVPAFGGVNVPGLTFGSAGRARTGASGGLGGVGGGGPVMKSGVHVSMVAYNPVAEPLSVTTNKTLQRVAALGLTG